MARACPAKQKEFHLSSSRAILGDLDRVQHLRGEKMKALAVAVVFLGAFPVSGPYAQPASGSERLNPELVLQDQSITGYLAALKVALARQPDSIVSYAAVDTID